MTDITFRSDVTVELIDSMGTDSRIVQAARVSTLGEGSTRTADDDTGLIKYLYRDLHGVPFEHVEFAFYFEVPVFVSRQIVKHRHSSINEESGRYKVLRPMFYVPGEERMLQQVGKTGDYKFEPGSPDQAAGVNFVLKSTAQASWDNYETLLEMGVAKEVARMHLPLNIYSSMYYKSNLSSILNFLSKRKKWEGAEVVSHAQYEIEMVSDKVADIVKEKVPAVWDAFEKNGYRRV